MADKQDKPIKPDKIPLSDPSLYFNRELSWLEFNDRVLEEAHDKTTPLFDRLKFLAITASNLDEFFMVRVSAALDMLEAGVNGAEPSGMTPKRQLEAITARTKAMSFRQYQTLNRTLLPLLAKEGIIFPKYGELLSEGKAAAEAYFRDTVFPVLTPMAIDQSRPFPLLPNKSVMIMAELGGDEDLFAVLQVPTVLPRFFALPASPGNRAFRALEDVIKPFAGRLFEGYSVISAHCFRVTRDADLDIEEEETQDLMGEIEKSIQRRKWGEPTRLEIERDMAEESRAFLLEALKVPTERVYEVSGMLDLTALFAIAALPDYENLKEPPMPPVPCGWLTDPGLDIFEIIKKRDLLVHRPYQSFEAYLRFINTATDDPKVLAIKHTIYRVGKDAPVLNALIRAGENGKQVTVLMELKARFDEENNILWAKRLERAGCHVVYGLVGLKTHCKICLVVRREDDGIRRYIHLGTGNYNAATAKIYTDLGMLTARETIGQDVSALFNVLTGYSVNLSWNKLAVAPTNLRQTFFKLIEREELNAKEGKPCGITAKMNALVDTQIIQALYRASRAGAPVRLIVRGICCLRPGVKGVSENITVCSVVGRFLEHSRIYWFENAGSPVCLLSSADLMPRNLERRVEVAFPVEDDGLKREIKEILDITLADTVKLRLLKPDGTYVKVDRRGKKPLSSQSELYLRAAREYKASLEPPDARVFIPVFQHGSDTDG
jgi:polyphosphate kinase